MIAIVNASSLIYLGKIGALMLVPQLFSHCYTILLVKEEVLSKKNTPEHSILEEVFSDWLKIKESKNQNLRKRLEEMQTHLGEASIIALGKELQEKVEENVILIDELAIREIARTLELNITGTIGVILKSMRLEIITKKKCKDFIQSLVENTTFRISALMYSKIFKEIDNFHAKEKIH